MSHINLQTLVGVATLLTAVSPYIAAVFTQSHYSRWVNEFIAVTVSVVFGVLSWLAAGGSYHDVHDFGSLWTVITLVSVGAKVYYEKLAKAAPMLQTIEWYTGGKQAGFPPPVAMTASTTLVDDDLPIHATDSVSASPDAPEDISPADVADTLPESGGEPSAVNTNGTEATTNG
jgi:hypothetical protein